jgi:hypothetical protein
MYIPTPTISIQYIKATVLGYWITSSKSLSEYRVYNILNRIIQVTHSNLNIKKFKDCENKYNNREHTYAFIINNNLTNIHTH